ncbi:LysM peptidoglycan-binding domain-containing protein [Oryzomonas japonica]|uniref:LysM peptidoglycan-binding domain-containing protein n=1 Tax=Oryzomonas japonica TaxID=2603858 RepID=A0A7J4ZUT9_9BACT|nr:LysM peptidoglycan-binding domain-containing protein [Oryzomonas japonica]KAB0667347.1 LysM peptidoglycan-binding domain-containing protein [Oryzomonas japonica]
MRIRLAMLLFTVALFVPGLALAADEEPTIYVIKQGDTLWGLSDRFIKNPRYWPNMWSRNSQITNPHLIYPGQKVRVFPDRLEFEPRDQAAPAAQKAAAQAETMAEVVAERTYSVRGSEGFLMETDAKPAGSIVAIHHDRIVAGDDDIVYTDIGKVQGAKGGEKFSVYRKEGTVSHPVTSEIMGTKVVPLGTLQLTDLEQKASRAIITKTYQEISPGSYLMPYRDDKRREVSLKMPTRELKGYIVESYSGTEIIAAGDIVYIDLGSAQGAEAGNMLYIIRDVALDRKYVEGRVERLPQELLGALVILETGKRTATALVVKSIDAIYKGDKLVSLTK